MTIKSIKTGWTGISALAGNIPNFLLGDYESIASTTVGAGGSSSVTFSSIPETFTHLQLRILFLNTIAQQNILMRFNSDSGNNYSWHEVYGYGQPSPASTAIINTPEIRIVLGATGTTNQAVGITDILDYRDTNKYKTSRTLTGADTNGGINYILFRSGNWRNTAAISTIDLIAQSGLFGQYSSVALYGIRG